MSKWKLALVQHPMYFIVRDGEGCAERTPPWGEPDVQRYGERIAENLATIREHPQLKLGFEWSGYEIELLAGDNPDLLREMVALASEGRTAFYNGTFSQPHLQMLSAEANYRQFERGTQVYRELCQQEVTVYAHQEASVHDQVPQLLAAFGIRFAVVPQFSSTLGWLEEGELVTLGGRGPRFVQGHELVRWRGLDNTEVPLYLRIPGFNPDSVRDAVASELMAGQQHVPPIFISVPDMVRVDDDWMGDKQDVDLVLLDAALQERMREAPPRAAARFYSNWSYIEGIRAEAMSRANWRAEAAALAAEAVGAFAALTVGAEPPDVADVWRTILATQHHDVYCFCAPGLKDLCLPWLSDAETEATRLAQQQIDAVCGAIDTSATCGQALVVFGATPHRHIALVTARGRIDLPVVRDERGNVVPSETQPVADASLDANANGDADLDAAADMNEIRFFARLGGLGYRTYCIESAATADASDVATAGAAAISSDAAAPVAMEQPVSFANEWYQATVEVDGTLSSLMPRVGGTELLTPGGRGNTLAATDSAGLSPRRPQMAAREDWQPPGRGPELHWQADTATELVQSPLGLTVRTRGALGERVTACCTVRLFHEVPWLAFSWEFSFDQTTIGTFYDDESKLRVRWPLAVDAEPAHDIPFGVINTPHDRPFFPASWVDVADESGGLAYFHRGTPKHWVSNGELVNLFAWGEDTEAIGSRMWRYNWPVAFDQRLQGAHRIDYAVLPHDGDWRAARVPAHARDYGATTLLGHTGRHAGRLPLARTSLALDGEALNATSVRATDGAYVVRCVNTGLEATAAQLVAGEPSANAANPVAVETRLITGEQVEHIAPFKIAHVTVRPAS